MCILQIFTIVASIGIPRKSFDLFSDLDESEECVTFSAANNFSMTPCNRRNYYVCQVGKLFWFAILIDEIQKSLL